MSFSKPNIFRFDDFRAFLSDAYDAAKAVDKKYSYRYFSKKAGFQSPSWLLQVIKGEKNLTDKGIEGLAKAFRLSREERVFFRDLVAFNQARSHTARNDAFERMAANRHFSRALKLETSNLEYLSHWYYVAIREMVSLPDFEDDPRWISKRLLPPITKEDARRALEVLTRTGLFDCDEDGVLHPVSTGTEVRGKVLALAVVRYHRQMLERAAESLELLSSKYRHFGVSTVSMSYENYLRFKDKLDLLVRQFSEAGDNDKAPTAVYQLHMSLFPLTIPQEEDPS